MKFKNDRQRKAVMANLGNSGISSSSVTPGNSVSATHHTNMMKNNDKITDIENSLKGRTSSNDTVDPNRTMPVFMLSDGSFAGWGTDKSQHQQMIIPYARELGIDPKIDDDDPRSYRTQFEFLRQTGIIRATSNRDELFVHISGKITTSQLNRIRELSKFKKLSFDLEPQYQGEFGFKRDPDKIYTGNSYSDLIKGLRQQGMLS